MRDFSGARVIYGIYTRTRVVFYICSRLAGFGGCTFCSSRLIYGTLDNRRRMSRRSQEIIRLMMALRERCKVESSNSCRGERAYVSTCWAEGEREREKEKGAEEGV